MRADPTFPLDQAGFGFLKRGTATVAAGTFDEAKHPRVPAGEPGGGRFGEGGDLAPPAMTPWTFSTTQAAQELLLTRPDGSKATSVDDHAERQLAKQTVAADVAARMTSTPADCARAAWAQSSNWPPGSPILGGQAAEDAYRALVAEAQKGLDPKEIADWGDLALPANGKQPNEADVLGRLQADSNMIALVVPTTTGLGTSINWIDTSTLSADQRATFAQAGYVPGNDASIGDAVKRAAVADMVAQWAATSNDASDFSLSMQETAAQTFGLKGTAGWPIGPDPAFLAAVQPVQQDFLNAMYANTQDFLKAQGTDTVVLQRGVGWGNASEIPGWAKTQGEAVVPLRPLSSWAANPDQAIRFAAFRGGANHGAVLSASIPAERILAMPRTGLGCLNEHEYIVIGGTERVHIARAASA